MAKKKSMSMSKSMCSSCETCGMHLCSSCAVPNIIFGLIFLIAGLGLWAGAPAWFNGWTVIGVYLALWGLMSGMMKK